VSRGKLDLTPTGVNDDGDRAPGTVPGYYLGRCEVDGSRERSRPGCNSARPRAERGCIWANRMVQQFASSKRTVRAQFGYGKIHNTHNLVKLALATHHRVSGLYPSKRMDITGDADLTVRQWIRTRSFTKQKAFGPKALYNVGVNVW